MGEQVGLALGLGGADGEVGGPIADELGEGVTG